MLGVTYFWPSAEGSRPIESTDIRLASEMSTTALACLVPLWAKPRVLLVRCVHGQVAPFAHRCLTLKHFQESETVRLVTRQDRCLLAPHRGSVNGSMCVFSTQRQMAHWPRPSRHTALRDPMTAPDKQMSQVSIYSWTRLISLVRNVHALALSTVTEGTNVGTVRLTA